MNASKYYPLSILILLFALFACSSSPQTSDGKGLATGQPGMNKYTDLEPGETSKLERAYETAPPFIPHNVTDLTIDKTVNDCFDCHLEGDELDEGHIATKIPESHYINEFSGKKETESVTGIRYNCRQCHVPQALADFPLEKKNID